MYRGFVPALVDDALGAVLWMAARNCLERHVPDPHSHDLRQFKHFVCGGVTGAAVTCGVFPLNTLKKKLQTTDGAEQRLLLYTMAMLKKGWMRRFFYSYIGGGRGRARVVGGEGETRLGSERHNESQQTNT